MQIGDNFHEVTEVSSEKNKKTKYFKMSSADFFTQNTRR